MSAPATARPHRTVLRLHRTALIVWGAFVAGLIAWLVWLSEITVDAVRAAEAACSRGPWGCVDVIEALDFSQPLDHVALLLHHSFLAVAAFAGGALIGRELESGTARLAWTQGVTPARWLAAGLAVPALALTAGGTVLVLAFRRVWEADRDLIPMADAWAFADVFVARGPATVAYALCALAVGTLTALLLRRALPALVVSVAAMWLLGVVLERCRPHLWPAERLLLRRESDPPHSAWLLEWSRTGTGRYATYHPASHFWPLHLVETGVVLAVAVLATASAFAVLRRRTA
ncbi:hypothetical protein [Streptomyces sp. Tu 3180]|uniref:hypothetical protein n=1 Tax=Streptomyces sp. Tu 3180 TaxID=2682611 RepID=UPI0013581ABD|nr:hypothetical protein [Streptomyces sp. Tu 3180]KAF3466192.1 hypothetical protein GL259_18870 [Streptomyces sp. Tu 3180]